MMALAYVGSDRENNEDARWWSFRAGQLVPTLLSVAPDVMDLPSDKA